MKINLLIVLIGLLSLTLEAQVNRSYNGSSNNTNHPEWGMTGDFIMRMATNGYADGIAAPGGITRPNPREVSNQISNQNYSIPNPYNITDFGWAFGQFIDHDITLVLDEASESIDIPVPANDPYFDPNGTGNVVIPMKRSKYDPSSGTSILNPRNHINDITAWIDASNVYGSDSLRAMWLRTFIDGKLKTSSGNLLPFNTITNEYDDPIDPTSPFMLIDGPPMPKHFIAGDIRANEQPILTSLHTLFMREHNRLCDEILQSNPGLTDEATYQYARKLVSAMIQRIVFNEWLPALGIQLPTYNGYDPNMQPNIMNAFSAAAFRLGHTLINGNLLRLDASFNPIPEGPISLKDAFFNPIILKDQGGVEPFFRGMSMQAQQNFDTKVVHDLRNFLFGIPGAGGLDLAAININRGRERGLPDYNTIRSDLTLPKYTSFKDITSDVILENRLKSVYGSIDDVDPWVGMLAEDHMPGAAIGQSIHTFLQMQFMHLRNGDRYYYENDASLSAADLQMIANSSLANLILRNTTIQQIQADVFHLDAPLSCAKPQNLQVIRVNETRATLIWDAAPGVDRYVIRGNQIGKNGYVHLTRSKNFKAMKNLIPGTTYIWQVQSVCDFVPSPISAFSSIDTFQTLQSAQRLSLNEPSNNYEILMYPNPSNGSFAIRMPGETISQGAHILIYDLNGQLVFQQTRNHESSDWSIQLPQELISGLYHVQLNVGNNQFNKRITIIN